MFGPALTENSQDGPLRPRRDAPSDEPAFTAEVKGLTTFIDEELSDLIHCDL